jgi:tRNA A-37 threonylcarbamoyl transferase component Bud32
MISSPTALALLAPACLLLALLAVRLRSRRRNHGFVVIAPQYRSFFRKLGATQASHFLALAGETPHIVSGHPDRHVARIAFNDEPWHAFLKCEHRVARRYRLANLLAGFGLSSRSLREASILQALQREDQPGPEWLAAGEDGRGRAFLLLREVPGLELRAFLKVETEPTRRRRLARRLGAVLARLHAAGYSHPDLYANHVFVEGVGKPIRILDWQRARLRRAVPWSDCRRDLAALNATVDDTLATSQERLLCLRSYWRHRSPFGVSWRTAVRGVEGETRRLLKRRHIGEKRQPPTHSQAWICLDGEALCVTPILRQRCGENIPHYLPQPGDADAMQRRWPILPDAGRALLVQRNRGQLRSGMGLRSPRATSPEQRQAALLLRLQRYNIPAPQVLAVGQRAQKGQRGSFILTEPLTDICSLEAWLARRSRRGGKASQRWSVLRQTGALLQRLHEASCYLTLDSAGCGLAVRRGDEGLAVVIERVESVTPRRRRQPRRAVRDVRRFLNMLRNMGCSRTDLCRFRAGYGPTVSLPGRRASKGKEVPRLRDGFVEPPIFDNRDALWRRLLFGVRRWCQRADWPRLAGDDWPNRIMDLNVADRFHAKQGRSTARWIVESTPRTPRLSVFLKRHYELPRWHGWLATLWPRRPWSPAWQEWRHLHWARQQGLSVPPPVAAAEYLGPWGTLQSALVVEELKGMLSLQEAIPLAAVRQQASAFRHWKRNLVVEIARLARMLHDRRCFHKDLYLCHFFIARDDTRTIPEQGWRGRVYLIDLHRLGHHPLMGKILQTKDLAQLLYASDILGVDGRDRLAFWRAYRGDGPHRPRCRWLRRFILYRWRRYRHHNARNQPTIFGERGASAP